MLGHDAGSDHPQAENCMWDQIIPGRCNAPRSKTSKEIAPRVSDTIVVCDRDNAILTSFNMGLLLLSVYLGSVCRCIRVAILFAYHGTVCKELFKNICELLRTKALTH